MEIAKPLDQHKWLARLTGEWTFESEMMAAPGEPPMKAAGKESTRMLGELWFLSEGEVGLVSGGEAEKPGGGVDRTFVTLGYDPAKGKFVGSFIGSMMHHLWPYEGELDASGKILALDSEGPSFAGDGKLAKYRDSVEIIDDDHRLLRSEVLGDEGAWTEFMVARYTRVG